MKKIIILGAGPTGLAAALRLRELGHEKFTVYERQNHAGGLCASFSDKLGFTWDLGGHVIFSHYAYFDNLLSDALGNDYLEHKRSAWIRMIARWIPYPFQNNLQFLPREVIEECLKGLGRSTRSNTAATNFEEWVLATMGAGIARHFMLPYNRKVWACDLSQLSTEWIAERVSPVNLKETMAFIRSSPPKTDWGPNTVFKFPLEGGTGQIFKKITAFLAPKIKFSSEIVSIDPIAKKVVCSDGWSDTYDVLINTSPLDQLTASLAGQDQPLVNAAKELKHNGIFIVGVGINGSGTRDKSWAYFPEDNGPFYRTTFFSNYSPRNVPDPERFYSLICESAYSDSKQEDPSTIFEKTLQGLVSSGVISEAETDLIVSKFVFDIKYGYPIPTLKRDAALRTIIPALEKMDIYSRGRFGAWKYEVGNTDHSVMQGKEIAERILGKGKECVWHL